MDNSEQGSSGSTDPTRSVADAASSEFRDAFLWESLETKSEAERDRLDKVRTKTYAKVRRAVVAGVEGIEHDEQTDNAILAYSYASLSLLHSYATLNYKHARRIHEVIHSIGGYAVDYSLTRPLNFLLLASPGSGKSQLARSIAQRIKSSPVDLASFNMATMQSKDDLGRVIDAARNMVVDRKLPLIFLDEFDSREAFYPLLLPLLWDGELDVANRDLRLGRCVFFLAGSRPSLPARLNNARDMSDVKPSGQDDDKLVDLFSRINGGVIEVPSLAGNDGAADKIVIAMQLLRHRFAACDRVPRSLLWFIARAKFRYEARSIATMINLIRVGPNARSLPALTTEHVGTLPFHSAKELRESPLAFHLIDPERVDGLIDLWQKEARERIGEQHIRHPLLDEIPLDTDVWIPPALSLLVP